MPVAGRPITFFVGLFLAYEFSLLRAPEVALAAEVVDARFRVDPDDLIPGTGQAGRRGVGEVRPHTQHPFVDGVTIIGPRYYLKLGVCLRAFHISAEQEKLMAKTTRETAERGSDREQTSAVDPTPTWRPVSEQMEMEAPHRRPVEIPPLGYPISEDAVSHWFQKTFGRNPDSAEVGVIIDAMAKRDAEQPATEPPTERVFLDR